MTPPYRFTEEDFEIPNSMSESILIENAVSIANTLLEKWEGESEKLYASQKYGLQTWIKFRNDNDPFPDTHTATLWNPKKIKGEK